MECKMNLSDLVAELPKRGIVPLWRDAHSGESVKWEGVCVTARSVGVSPPQRWQPNWNEHCIWTLFIELTDDTYIMSASWDLSVSSSGDEGITLLELQKIVYDLNVLIQEDGQQALSLVYLTES